MDGYSYIPADEINGHSVIASAIVDQDTRLILAEGWKNDGLVYVVAHAPVDNNGEGWNSGRYFDAPGQSRENKRRARKAFATMLAERWS